jgi:hypothetical protein
VFFICNSNSIKSTVIGACRLVAYLLQQAQFWLAILMPLQNRMSSRLVLLILLEGFCMCGLAVAAVQCLCLYLCKNDMMLLLQLPRSVVERMHALHMNHQTTSPARYNSTAKAAKVTTCFVLTYGDPCIKPFASFACCNRSRCLLCCPLHQKRCHAINHCHHSSQTARSPLPQLA